MRIGNPIGISTFSIPSTYYEDQYMINTDYILSPKHTLSERYFYANYPEDQPLGTAGNTPGNGVATAFVSQLAVLKLTSALNAHFLNEALVGYIRSSGHSADGVDSDCEPDWHDGAERPELSAVPGDLRHRLFRAGWRRQRRVILGRQHIRDRRSDQLDARQAEHPRRLHWREESVRLQRPRTKAR